MIPTRRGGCSRVYPRPRGEVPTTLGGNRTQNVIGGSHPATPPGSVAPKEFAAHAS
jgi:hypothetical protein